MWATGFACLVDFCDPAGLYGHPQQQKRSKMVKYGPKYGWNGEIACFVSNLQGMGLSKDLDSSKSPKGKMPGPEGKHGQTSEHRQ